MIHQVHADDYDEGPNSELVYSISDVTGQPTTAVSINSTSGHLTADVTFDRETRDLYEFIVTARDHGRPAARSVIFSTGGQRNVMTAASKWRHLTNA